MMLEMFLSSSALILAVLLIRLFFGRRMGAGLRYALWLVVLLRLLLPFSFGESAASPANLVKLKDTQAVILSTPIYQGTPGDAGITVDPDTGEVHEPNSFGYTQVNQDGTITRYAGRHPLPAGLTDSLPILWIAGMALLAPWFLSCNLLFYRRLRKTRQALDLSGRTPVYLAALPSPCVFGLLRPAIYVTEQAASSPPLLSQVLLHERTHLRHGDQLWSFLRTVCLIVWWFHPLVWIAAAASRQDCELFCDEAVIRQLGEARRSDYGRTLLELAGGRRTIAAFCAVSTLSGGGKSLKRRIRAIAHWARPRKWAAAAAVLLLLPAALCAFTGAKASAEMPADVLPADVIPAPAATDSPMRDTETPDSSDGQGNVNFAVDDR